MKVFINFQSAIIIIQSFFTLLKVVAFMALPKLYSIALIKYFSLVVIIITIIEYSITIKILA